jgi:protein-tyrosine phosphatase
MYALHWITAHLATGSAPLSYAELDAIRQQGIGAIVNLCGEFCDLHQIEEESGFEVYYLPVADECAPDLAAMEKALDWLDEAIYLNKKVLVHCRLGHGRTGTLIAAYLLRRGFDFNAAEQTLKGKNAHPATYEQRRFLKKYGKQAGPLRTARPRIDNRPAQESSPLLLAYEALITRFDQRLRLEEREHGCAPCNRPDCHQPFDLLLIESMHLSRAINQTLRQEQRRLVIGRAVDQARRLQMLRRRHPGLTSAELAQALPREQLQCPLLEAGVCLLFADRPPRCRYGEGGTGNEQSREIMQKFAELSQQAVDSLTGRVLPEEELRFSLADTLSGKFVERYFQAMTKENE